MPYGPLIEAIRPRIERERAPDDLLEDVWLSELSRLLPELKERYPDLPSPLSVERETAKGALFEAIVRLVGGFGLVPLVVLFLDDLQGRRRNARDAGLRGEALGGAGSARACADHCAYGGTGGEPGLREGSCHWAEGCP